MLRRLGGIQLNIEGTTCPQSLSFNLYSFIVANRAELTCNDFCTAFLLWFVGVVEFSTELEA